MKIININNLPDIKLDLIQHTSPITTLSDAKRFKTYIGWSFAKALNCEKYALGIKYSFLYEAKRLYEIIDKYYQDENKKNSERKKMEKKVEEYINNSQDLLFHYQKDSESSSSTSNKDFTSSDKNNKVDNKKTKKEPITDIKGDFDVIIPNVETESFLKMLENNFYSKNTDKCIVYDEDKIKNLPQYFNLFIEVGISSFISTYKHKTQQIRKYIAILNFANNIIEDKIIREIYEKDFKHRFYLDLNTNKGKKADISVFMLIGNNSYGEFTSRFLDNRKSLFLNNNNELNSIISKDSKEILLCGFVDFPKIINCFHKDKLLNDQKKEIANLKERLKEMDKMKEELERMKLYIHNNSMQPKK